MGGGAVVHDSKGNLTQEGGRNLAYDSENRLTSVTTPQNFGIAYDPQGRFRGVTLTGLVAAFDMVGTDIVAARNNGGPTVERYAFGPGVDEPMVGYDNAGARYYFHADGHGNVVAHSGAAGSATRTIGYDEYGKPSLFSSRFLHAGKMHLGGVNAYYNNARFYDYNLGRFLQVDPVGYDGGINLYAYVGSDPVNRTDPDGQQAAGFVALWERLSPETKETIADAVEVIGVVADVATLPTGVGSGPEMTIAGKALATAIRRSAKEGGDAAATRARNVAKGIPESRLGPSGKIKLHQRDHSTMRRAEDAARSRTARGQSPIRHSNPAKGKPHFHGVDAKGRKRQDGVHDNYPRKGGRGPDDDD